MHQQNHIAEGWRLVAGMLQAAAWPTARRLLVVATLALMFGGADRLAPAQADAAGDASVNFSLYAQKIGGERTICVGDKVQFRTSVLQRVGVEGDYTFGRLLGVEIGAFMDGSGVGTISPERVTTGLSSDSLGSGFFTFSAAKAGTTTVVFQGRINQRFFLGLAFGGNTVTASQTLTVEDCKYRVNTFSRWRVAGPANLNVVANITEAGMVEDGGGHYAGTARVEWAIGADQVGDCTGTVSATPSQAELKGQVYGHDEFVVNLRFQTATATITQNCRGIGGTMQVQLTQDPLQVSVPASGGSERQSTVLVGPGGPEHGSIRVIVSRARGQ